ncbi:MAG: gliding motility lipoprotein GldH [Ferruginibacter sp.]|nr:gliding motility lipoprotein GldH [Ferruginibacter sp.]
MSFKFRVSKLSAISYCLLFFALSSCKQLDVFEKNTPIPKYSWASNYVAKGDLSIADTTSAYNLYIVLRHTDAYKYNNIWLNIEINNGTDSLINQKIDIGLATDATGWEGVGMNDIRELRKKITPMPFKFKKVGNYSYQIKQVMRDNPLNNIMSVGIRFEKVNF